MPQPIHPSVPPRARDGMPCGARVATALSGAMVRDWPGQPQLPDTCAAFGEAKNGRVTSSELRLGAFGDWDGAPTLLASCA